ncbi:MAG: protein kinase domain-containing protein [Candidatus Woesearchaeota archaeon]
MTNLTKGSNHIKEVLDSIPKENFQLVKVFNNNHTITYPSSYSKKFLSNGVAVVKNNKLAGRLEDIKFLESLEPESRKIFLREGKILSAMHHKNIPNVYDILELEDVLLFRYEHVDGYSLKEVLDYFKKEKMHLDKYVITSIILKLLNALHYAHNDVKFEGQKKSIIHCDIKPSNIILCAKEYTRKGQNGHVDEKFINLLKQNKVEPFLIDFGIAKFSGTSNTDGTINYLSPSQIKNTKLDWRTDIYQLLLVYYEMLSLTVPYSSISRSKILEKKLNQDFVIDKNSNINGSIKDFIEKGTKRNILESFKSEKECINVLSKIELQQKKLAIFNRYKKPFLTILGVLILIAILCLGCILWL